jgi:hypothetical protein
MQQFLNRSSFIGILRHFLLVSRYMFRPNWPSSGVYYVRLLLFAAMLLFTASASCFVYGWCVVYGFVCIFSACSCWVVSVLTCCSTILVFFFFYLKIVAPRLYYNPLSLTISSTWLLRPSHSLLVCDISHVLCFYILAKEQVRINSRRWFS